MNIITSTLNQRWLLILLFLILAIILVHFSIFIVLLIESKRLIPISVQNVVTALPLIVILYIVGCVLVARSPIRHPIGWYSLFFVIRLLVAIILSLLFLFDDERGFHYRGITQPHGFISFEPGNAYYSVVVILYYIFGANILLPKTVNVFIGSLIPFIIVNIANKVFKNQKVAWRAFLLSGFLPPFVFFSAVALKEILSAFLLLIIIYTLINANRGIFKSLLCTIIIIVLLYWVRGAPLALVVVTGSLAYYTWNIINIIRSKKMAYLIPISLLLFAIGIYVIFNLLSTIQEIIHNRLKHTYYIERFVKSQAAVMRFLNAEQVFTPKNLVILFLRGLYSPNPLRCFVSPCLGTFIESLTMLVWYILFPLAIIGTIQFRNRAEVVIISIMGFAILAMATMGPMVGSDPLRHRIMGMTLFVILASAAFNRKTKWSYCWITWMWIIGALGFIGLWLTLRLYG